MLCSLLSDPRELTHMEDPNRYLLDWQSVESDLPLTHQGAPQPNRDMYPAMYIFSESHTKLNINGVLHECVQAQSLTTNKCLYCKVQKVTTKAGHRVTTMFRCSVCKVPLCKKRGCFFLFHQQNENALKARQWQQIRSPIT